MVVAASILCSAANASTFGSTAWNKHAYICRAENAPDLWTVSAAYDRQEPQITKVLVRADSSAACVSDDTAPMPRHQKPAAPSKVRAKHVLDEPVIQPAPKQKRSR